MFLHKENMLACTTLKKFYQVDKYIGIDYEQFNKVSGSLVKKF